MDRPCPNTDVSGHDGMSSLWQALPDLLISYVEMKDDPPEDLQLDDLRRIRLFQVHVPPKQQPILRICILVVHVFWSLSGATLPLASRPLPLGNQHVRLNAVAFVKDYDQ